MNVNIKNPRICYRQQKAAAERRGIPFSLTFEEWWEIWDKSGKWPLRGKKKGQYVMGRNKDTGGYEKGNVSIILMSENIKLQRAGRKPTLGMNLSKSRDRNKSFTKKHKRQILKNIEKEIAKLLQTYIKINAIN
jgi:hypothetical protein